ncbi:DNA topoisomerase 1 isoform X3 [Tachysurus fulvidraco]|uniref:DNA topoisomerase 1 isoform X3 n=1 Tax=Tachysurus fulvidraco TaxID=1234273 RepID=UPI001FED6CCE|nr:DNA topoisomerase 1 isoform X3 [Tachysurus fulvidraco]
MAQEDKVKKVKAEKAKESALTHDLSGGDARPNFKKVQAKSTEKSQKGKKQQKVKSPKKERTDFEIADDKRIKEEANDADFMPEKKGKKRKRKLESVEGPSSSTALSLPKKKKKEKASQEGDESFGPEKRKKKAEAKNKKVKKEEEEHPVAVKKTKKTKEEIEAARALKIKKKEEEEQQRWRWWEEEKYADGIKWKFLEHNGPYFPPEYQPLPDKVKFYYDGKPVKLSLAAEEVALFFAQMLDHEYTTKDVFRDNFFADWRKEMTLEERMLITDLNKCDFGELHAMHRERVEARKNMSKEEKLVIKEANQKILEEYGYCMLDKHRERIGNFKIEPPALFRGRGEHPKQGMLKKRIRPEDVTINCSRDSRIPVPPAGHSWKEVRHDNTVTWLASWTENIQGSCKYVMLNANSKLKGEKDWEKYEVARKLKTCVDAIRAQYQQDLKSKQMGVRQRAVALYFIDKTALLNKHLSSLMPGLTAKVFRTYNASMTLQQQLKELSNPSDNQAEKLLSYNRANRAVAVLCNHQRAAPKTFEQSMANLQAKIESRKEQLALAKKELKQAKKEAKANSDSKLLAVVEKKKKTVHRCEEQLLRMEVQATDKEENKQIALSTSKLNYLDPRISVAWCKNMEVPLDKIYNKTQRDKFAWAIDMTELDFMF